MPPLARTIGLILVLMGPLCVVAETYLPAAEARFTSATGTGKTTRPQEDWANYRPPGPTFGRCPNPYRPGKVIQTGFQSVGPMSDRMPESSPPQPSSYRADAEPNLYGSSAEPLALPGRSSPVALPPRGRSSQVQQGTDPGGLSSLLTVGSSLVVVLGLFFVVAWAMRRATPGNCPTLPEEVVEILGRATVANRQQLQLLRCGNKLLLVCVTPASVETLTEITDLDEVNRLAGLCRQKHPGSTTAMFRQVLQQVSGHRREDDDV